MLGLTVRVGAAVDRVGENTVQVGVDRTLPVDLSARTRGWKLQSMLLKPQQRLSYRADFLELVEHQQNRLLHAPIWVLLEALILGFAKPDRYAHDQLTALGLCVPRLERTLSQQIQLALVEAALQS